MKKLLIFITIISLLTAHLYGSGRTEEIPEDFILKVTALNGPTGIGMIHLFENHPDLGEHIQSQFSVALAPKALIGDLAKGTIDIAVLPANMPALLYSKEIDYKVAAITGQGVLYVVSSDASIKSLDDLRGKTLFNGAKGATPDFLSRIILEKASINPDEDLYMDFSYGLPDLAKAMIGGLVQTAVLPEPLVTQITEKSDAKVVIDLQQVWREQQDSADSYPMSVLVIKQSILENYPEMVEKFMKAYENSINLVNSDPSGSSLLIPKHGFTLTAPIAEKAIPRLNLKFMSGIECREELSRYYEILFELDRKIIGGNIPAEDLYYIGK